MDTSGEQAVCVPDERLLRSGRDRVRDPDRVRVSRAALAVLALLSALSIYLVLQHFPVHKRGALTNATSAVPQGAAKPRAHLTAKETSGEISDLQWEDKNGLAFTMGAINYQNPALIIPTDGDYFVYSQVSFRGMRSSGCEHVTHTVIKQTLSYPEAVYLLSSTKSICNEKSPWFVAIYLGAVFQLEKGDRLVVHVSNVTQVDFTHEHKTFFGTFLL